MATPLINTPSLPGFEKPIDSETQAMNNEYDNNNGDGFQQWKESGGGLLFGKFDSKKPTNKPGEESNNDSDDIAGNLEEVENKRKIDENPDTPLIDSLVEQGIFEVKEGKIIKNALINGANIKDIKIITPDKQQEIIDLIGDQTKEECLEKFNIDFKNEVDGLKEQVGGNSKGEKELTGRNTELIKLLGGNYFNLGGEENDKDSLDRAFKTSLNQLMDGKSFKRPETFDTMLNTVRNPELSFKERFEVLKKVDVLIINDQSRSNGKQANAFQKMKAGSETQKLSFKQEFNKLKELFKIAKEQQDQKKIEELLAQSTEFKKEVDAEGDIFVAGDLDILIGEIEDSLKEQD